MPTPKSRLLTLLDILSKDTDEDHPITIAEIINRLDAEGLSANRHTVMNDIETLLTHGVDVVCNKSRQNQYFIGERQFQLPELKLLVDAVQASKFISAKKSKELIAKLSALASIHQASQLKRHLFVDKQIKSANESTFYTVDLLNKAIDKRVKVEFMYFDYTAAKKKVLKHGAQIYIFSPYTLLWNNDSYYVLGYSENHGKIAKFRVDRMSSPKLTEIAAVRKPKGFKPEEYCKSVFSMYDEEISTVKLVCENDLMKSIIDRFGEKVKTEITDAEYFNAEVDVSVSPTFFGWLVGFNGRIKPIAPDDVVKRYAETLQSILNGLE